MKLVLRIEVDVDEEALARYYERYPGFQEEPAEPAETAADTLIREAVAAWEFEGLLTRGVEPVGVAVVL